MTMGVGFVCVTPGCPERLRGVSDEPTFCSVCAEDLTPMPMARMPAMVRCVEKVNREGDENMQRARNPYRAMDADDGMMMSEFAGISRAPRRHDGDEGPGLLASDIDRMVRQHYFDGWAACERAYEPKLEAAQRARADAFDEGTKAQDGLNTTEVWRAVRYRVLTDLHFTLQQLEQAPKSRRDEKIGELRAAVDRMMADVDAMMGGGAGPAVFAGRDVQP